jgi:hypothetical protein
MNHNTVMKSIYYTARLAALTAILIASNALVSHAQFSQPVVVLRGTVFAEESAKPTSVKVSIREAGDTAREITSSTSNSETGKYLVVLKPGKKYWVHMEGDTILTKDVMIETPVADHTQQIQQDFTVVTREIEETPVTSGQGVTPVSGN